MAVRQGWIRREHDYLFLDDAVAKQLRRNRAERAKAFERWADVLMARGAVDRLYLSARPLVTLGRFEDAARVLTEAGFACGDDGWCGSVLTLRDALHHPRLMDRPGA